MSGIATQSATGGLERIYDALESTLPGVAHAMVQLAVWDALEEFCVRSTFWRESVAWEMPVGVTGIDLNPLDANTRIQWILEVCGLSCHQVKPAAILLDTGHGLVTPGDTVRSGTVWAVLKPSGLGSSLPDWVHDWNEGIRDGALARLYLQPAKPYSNLKSADYHAKRFRTQIQLARAEARTVCRRPPRFPYFARGRDAYGWPIGDGCCGPGGTGGGVTPPVGTFPTLAISPGVLSDAPVGTLPSVTISPGVLSDSAGASYSLSVTTLDFPAEPPTVSSPDETVTITNTGSVPLVITSASASGDFALTGLTLP